MTRIRKETWKMELPPLSIWKVLCWHIRFRKIMRLQILRTFCQLSWFTPQVFVSARFLELNCATAGNNVTTIFMFDSTVQDVAFGSRVSTDDGHICWLERFPDLLRSVWPDKRKSCSWNKLVWITLDDLCPRAFTSIRSRIFAKQSRCARRPSNFSRLYHFDLRILLIFWIYGLRARIFCLVIALEKFFVF